MKKLTLLSAFILLACAVMAGCGGALSNDGASASPTASQNAQTTTAAPAPSLADAPTDSLESAATDASEKPNETEDAGLVDTAHLSPISANQIRDGKYSIEVSSSSSMFRIVDCQLIVAGDEMTAVMTLSGTGYGKLYMGTGEQAEGDSEDKYIPFEEDDEGMYTYEVPVEALDKELEVTAWSIRKEKWYDRQLVFLSGQLPADAIE